MKVTHQIVDDETPIARYMSFEKFFHLMTFSQAFWPSIYSLRGASGSQGDPLEGTAPEQHLFAKSGLYEALDQASQNVVAAYRGKKVDSSILTSLLRRKFETPFGEKERKDYVSVLEEISPWIDVWCWNKYDHERVDMWRAYGGGAGSVMITSTVGMVKRSLKVSNDLMLAVAEVEYIEADKEAADFNLKFSPFTQKSHVYSSEKELRFLIYDQSSETSTVRAAPGREVQLDLKSMITNVVAHYQTSDWMMQSINAITKAAIDKDAQESYIKQEIESSRRARSLFLKASSLKPSLD